MLDIQSYILYFKYSYHKKDLINEIEETQSIRKNYYNIISIDNRIYTDLWRPYPDTFTLFKVIDFIINNISVYDSFKDGFKEIIIDLLIKYNTLDKKIYIPQLIDYYYQLC